jgi:hypothetical protein
VISALPKVVTAVGFAVRLAVVAVRLVVHVLAHAGMIQGLDEAVSVPEGPGRVVIVVTALAV